MTSPAPPRTPRKRFASTLGFVAVAVSITSGRSSSLCTYDTRVHVTSMKESIGYLN